MRVSVVLSLGPEIGVDTTESTEAKRNSVRPSESGPSRVCRYFMFVPGFYGVAVTERNKFSDLKSSDSIGSGRMRR